MTGDLGIRSWVEVMEGADITLDSETGPEMAPLRIIGDWKISRPVSFWIIVGSISGGLCVLSLIIIVLYKVGFFNRNRPPAEFYRDRSKTIEVVDDSNDPWVSGEIEEAEDDDDGDFVFRNPMCDRSKATLLDIQFTLQIEFYLKSRCLVSNSSILYNTVNHH
eukprot:sb/3472652/